MSIDSAVVPEGSMESVYAKAASDQDFRTRLFADPRGVISAEGVPLPEGVDVKLVEISATEVMVPVPPYMGDQLDLDQLESVSGGVVDVGGQIATVINAGTGFVKSFASWYHAFPKHRK